MLRGPRECLAGGATSPVKMEAAVGPLCSFWLQPRDTFTQTRLGPFTAHRPSNRHQGCAVLDHGCQTTRP
jgi:hypothetical protein